MPSARGVNVPPATPRRPSGESSPNPAAPPPRRLDPNDLDGLRAALNDSLREKRYDDAVEAAGLLRDLLKSKASLNPRELKSLAGAESVLRRFSEQGSTDLSGVRRAKMAWAIGTGIVVLAILAAAILFRSGPDPYTHAAELALEALDRIDAAVSKPIGVGDYQRLVRKEHEPVEAFLSKYRDDHRGDLGYSAVAAALAAYDSVMNDWPKSAGSGKRLSTSEPPGNVPFPRIWLAAHAYEFLARRVIRKEPLPQGKRDLTTAIGRLVGHWSDGSIDIYYSPIDPQSGLGTYLTRSSRSGSLDLASYESAPPPSPIPGRDVMPTPSPSPSASGAIDLRIVQYLPRASTVILRVSLDHLAGGTLQLVRLDDKTRP